MQEGFHRTAGGWDVVALILALLQATWPPAIPEDSAESLRRAARSAERRYEYLLRRLAPVRYDGGYSGRCDEIVGRFCLIYEGGDPPKFDPPPPEILRARQDVVDALRRAFAGLPGDLDTAGPLLRYLIEDGRADEALSAALTFAWATTDSVWGDLLLGYAYHATANDSAAERSFDAALARMSAEDRRRFESIEVFLSGRERSLYRKLSPEERALYETQFWRLADPLYLLEGNERRAEHFARHVWGRLLSITPRVTGVHSWGRDLEELTLRYGVPTSRERIVSQYLHQADSYVEHYPPDQLTFEPAALRTEGIGDAPPPGAPWPLEPKWARSGYAPGSVRRLVPVDHQVVRFPAGDSVALRIYGQMPLDSAAERATRIRAGLFLLDLNYAPAGERRGAAELRDSIAFAALEFRVAPGRYVYSFELLEEESRLAGRSRYGVDVPGYPRTGVALSDPVLAEPFRGGALPSSRDDAALRPLARLVFEEGDTVGLYAEAHGLQTGPDGATRYAVELSVVKVDEPSLLARAARWLGRQLGLTRDPGVPRLSWEGQGEGGRAAVLAVDLPLTELDPGLHELELTVTDLVGGGQFTTRRLLRIGASSL